ncbi:basic salivary proline-rich protein 3-like [Talpa occidentalis]|uniref:basic salivary proline-rich protein 3-like n=1 Tax=Talpa occidentalis TaxID=50954 RepID=UPI00188EB2FD|nr:basic salivary proline-rich protein 3-like [Talpa occidentalis]
MAAPPPRRRRGRSAPAGSGSRPRQGRSASSPQDPPERDGGPRAALLGAGTFLALGARPGFGLTQGSAGPNSGGSGAGLPPGPALGRALWALKPGAPAPAEQTSPSGPSRERPESGAGGRARALRAKDRGPRRAPSHDLPPAPCSSPARARRCLGRGFPASARSPPHPARPLRAAPRRGERVSAWRGPGRLEDAPAPAAAGRPRPRFPRAPGPGRARQAGPARRGLGRSPPSRSAGGGPSCGRTPEGRPAQGPHPTEAVGPYGDNEAGRRRPRPAPPRTPDGPGPQQTPWGPRGRARLWRGLLRGESGRGAGPPGGWRAPRGEPDGKHRRNAYR